MAGMGRVVCKTLLKPVYMLLIFNNIIKQLVFICILSDNDVWSVLTDLIVLEHL